MSVAKRDELDDVLDARVEIRRLKKVVADCGVALASAKGDLKAANERSESLLVEIEVRQGRLPLDFEANGRPGKKPGPAAAAG
jgi:hypothetical protein